MGDQERVIRVTQLEQFRKWMSDKYEFITEQSVIDSLTGAFKGNEKTYVGTAFHSIVEGAPQCTKVPNGRAFNIDGNTVKLGIEACKVALEYRNKFPWAFHEIRLYKDYGDVTITGQADLINGNEIHDIKTRFSPVRDDESYSESCQWKFYCDMFDVDKFIFDIFIFNGYNDGMVTFGSSSEDALTVDVRTCNVELYDPPIVCYPYEGMKEELSNLVHEFMEWVKLRGLTDYLHFSE